MQKKIDGDKELLTFFKEDLIDLRRHLLAMSNLVKTSLSLSIKSLIKKDSKLAEKVIEGDDKIDQMELDIEEECLEIIALKQPVDKKLRVITCGMKIITDLERVGDHAVNIARASQYLAKKNLVKPLIDIPRMANLAQEMLQGSLDAYLREDVDLAKHIWKKDEILDQLNQQIFRELLTFMLEDPRTINRSIYLIFISDNLERIGDHAGNLAERVLYMVNGERIQKKFNLYQEDN